MTRTGLVALAVVTWFAANIAFVIFHGGGLNDGYGRLFLLMLGFAFALVVLVILIFDWAWRSARTRRLSYRNLQDLVDTAAHDDSSEMSDSAPGSTQTVEVTEET